MHIVVIHEVMRGYKDGGGVYQGSSSGLDETDGGRFFTETLTTEVKTIFAYYPCLVGAQTALARTLSVLSGAREPNGVVCHGGD